MAPSLIFDKSAFQSLNPDEAMWLDNFFIGNITPLFFVEMLADLEKEVRGGRTPEQVVGNLAYKTPENGCINTHHTNLLYGELTGQGVLEMDFRPVISGGRVLKLGDETGVVYDEPPEVEAFKRWQKHEFLDVERTIAKQWRSELLVSVTPEDIKKRFQPFLDAFGKPKSFVELKKLVDTMIENPAKEEILTLGLALIGVMPEARSEVLKRWKESGESDLKNFAPYFVFVTSINLFFYLGTAADLFSSFRHAQTHMVDIAYLYYLPFCNIFVSSDKLHIGIVPLFMHPDQTFLDGKTLKDELTKLDTHYSQLPEDVKARGVVSFAMIPPDDTSFLTTKMWDKYMAKSWRDIKPRKFDGTDRINPEIEKALIEKLRKFTKEAKPVETGTPMSSDDGHSMIITRNVSKIKGKWRKFPPEVEDSQKRILT